MALIDKDAAPVIEVKSVKHGYWINGRICSNCGYDYIRETGRKSTCCPDCGAQLLESMVVRSAEVSSCDEEAADLDPVDCAEMKATFDLYHMYADKFNTSTIPDEIHWYADMCSILLSRIREMEKRLHQEMVD